MLFQKEHWKLSLPTLAAKVIICIINIQIVKLIMSANV